MTLYDENGTPFQRGQFAYSNDQGLEDNIFPDNSDDAREWSRGWLDAKKNDAFADIAGVDPDEDLDADDSDFEIEEAPDVDSND